MKKQSDINEYEELLAEWESFMNWLHTEHKFYTNANGRILIHGDLLPINMEIGSPDDAVEWHTFNLNNNEFVQYHIAKGLFCKDGFPSEKMYEITDFIDTCDAKIIQMMEEMDMNVVDSIDMFKERRKEIEEWAEEFKVLKEKWEYEEEQKCKEVEAKQHRFFNGLEPDVRDDNTFWATIKW